MKNFYKQQKSKVFAGLKSILVMGALTLGQGTSAQMYPVAGTCTMTTSTTYGPMNTSTNSSATGRYATIYPASQLTGIANEVISSVYFHKGNSANIAGSPNFKIYLKETTATDLGTTAADWSTLVSGATLVYDSNPSSAITGASGWKEFALSTPFTYSGTSNLLVLTEYLNTGNTTSVSWTYEYTSPCVNTSNNYTSRYATTTTGTLPTSLTSNNYRRPRIGFDFLVSCMWPSNVTVTSATSNSVNLSWTAPLGGAPANGYEVYYSTTNTAPTASTTPQLTGITATSATLSGLQADTTYYIWVRSNCSTTEKSNWTAVTTARTGYCLPANSGSYYVKNITTTGGLTNIDYSASSYQSYVNNSSLYLDVLPGVNPQITITPSSGTNYYYVWVDWNNDLDFSDAGETLIATTSYAANYTGNLVIPASVGSGEYRMRIANSYSGAATACGPSTYGNHVDYTLRIIVPSCWSPSTVTIANITSDSAVVSWAAPTTPPATYDLYYSTSNTPPTASTVPQLTGITGTSATLNNLTPLTPYYVWVRGNCGTDTGIWSSVGMFTSNCLAPALLSTNGATVCYNGSATLTATADAGATIRWYDSATGGNLLATGGSYTTPQLTANTDYWVSATGNVTEKYVGPVNPSFGSSGGSTGDYFMYFTVNEPIKLKTVDIYPATANQTGAIEIYNEATNALVGSVPVTTGAVSSTVPQVIDLDITLAPGNYSIKRTNSLNLVRNTTNASYPYSTPEISITASNFTTSSAFYYFFYNWKYETGCESARQQVTATIDPNCLGTDEVSAKGGLKVYPNPFVDTVTLSNVEDVASISVVDASGRVVKTLEKVEKDINLSSLKSGLYLLNVVMKNGDKTSVKVIKK